MRSLLVRNTRQFFSGARPQRIKTYQEYFQSISEPMYAKTKDFGLLDLMFLNLFVIGPTFYISGALNIRGQKNKKD